MPPGLVTLFTSELVLRVWRHVRHIVISLNMLMQDKAEQRKCRGRETGLCNLLLSDSLLRKMINFKKKKNVFIYCLNLSMLHWTAIVLLLNALKVRRGQMEERQHRSSFCS